MLATVVIMFALSAGGASRAQSSHSEQSQPGNTTAATEPPAVRIDKSQFNLFNPTPAGALRPFSTDRPGKTHSPLTVDAGHVQVEGDLWNYSWDHWSNTDTTQRGYSVVNPNFKLGLTNWAELDVIVPLYNKLAVRSRNGGGSFRTDGFGDVQLGGKVNFFGNDSGDQALGAIGFVKVPTARGALGNNLFEYTLNLVFTTTLPQQFSLTVEPAIGVLRNLYNQGYQADYQILFNLSRPIIGEVVTAAIELALDYPGDPNIGPRHTIDPSLQWLVTPNVQLDIGVYIGLTKAAPDFNPYVGMSFRF